MAEIDTLNQSVRQLENESFDIFKKHLTLIDSLNSTFFDEANQARATSLKVQKNYLEKIRSAVNEMDSMYNLNLLEQKVNSVLDNILVQLAEALPMLKRKDIVFMALVYAGFTINTISIILKMSSNTAYSKQRNIRERILSLNDEALRERLMRNLA